MFAKVAQSGWVRFASAVVLALFVIAPENRARAAATIVIQNGNAAGVGFNDPAPAVPVGGNAGTTLGQQRLIAFQAAANIWGATLTSVPTITILATFEPLTCTATSAVLGSAGAIQVWRDFTNAPIAASWYPESLANARFGSDIDPATPEIRARFNSNLGTTNCLPGSPFYLGLDNNHGPSIDLVTVLLHEFGHGLGFQTFTNGVSGATLAGFASAFDRFMVDGSTGLTWANMTNAERQASALNTRRVAWNGANVTGAVPAVLTNFGVPELQLTSPASVSGTYLAGTASFGAQLTGGGLTGEIMPVSNPVAGAACNPLSPADAIAVNGKIALVDRGVCGFAVKAKTVQNAGAVGVIIVNNAAGSPPPGLGGTDPSVLIPTISVTQADGNALKAALATRSRTRSGMFATMRLNLSQRLGADTFGRALLFTPNPFQGGSSLSHWDTIAFPNLLMEPAINADLSHSVVSPQDLTHALLRDLGWQ